MRINAGTNFPMSKLKKQKLKSVVVPVSFPTETEIYQPHAAGTTELPHVTEAKRIAAALDADRIMAARVFTILGYTKIREIQLLTNEELRLP